MRDLERLFAVGGGERWCRQHPAITFTRAAVASCGPALGEEGGCHTCAEPPTPDWLSTPFPDHGTLWLVDKRHAYLTAMREVELEGLPGRPYRPLADWLMRSVGEAEARGDPQLVDDVKAIYRVGIGCLAAYRGRADWRVAIIAKHIELMEVMRRGLERDGAMVVGQGATDGFLLWTAEGEPRPTTRTEPRALELATAHRIMTRGGATGKGRPPRTLAGLLAAYRHPHNKGA